MQCNVGSKYIGSNSRIELLCGWGMSRRLPLDAFLLLHAPEWKLNGAGPNVVPASIGIAEEGAVVGSSPTWLSAVPVGE